MPDRLLSLRRRTEVRTNDSVPITGITEFPPQPRLEIRQLEKNTDAWNIYLLGSVHPGRPLLPEQPCAKNTGNIISTTSMADSATRLRKFKATNQTDRLSYYRIAAIHGRPYGVWDNVKGVHDEPGYCAHISNLFLPWHRPYLALYEQVLFEHIIDAVNEFPTGAIRRRYASAALSWRMPFWDWAAQPEYGQSVFPSSISNPTVVVTTPNGTRTIDNPLYSYKFQPLVSSDLFFDPFAGWNETKRYPTGWVSDAVSQEDLIGPVLDNSRVSFMNRLYNLFTYYENMTQFGTEAWLDDTFANADSLESLHDTIHSLTGNNGHMTFLDFSAYDPIFWLHHTMLDRCFALWQALYPDHYVEAMRAVSQTFTVSIGDTLDGDTPLLPFSSDTRGTRFTSKDVRQTLRFGYSYSETSGNTSISAVKRAINKLYGSNASAGGPVKRAMQPASKEDLNTSPGMVVNGCLRHYVANVVSQKFAMNGSYAVYVFVGDFEEDPRTWPLSENLAGTHAVAASMASIDTANRRPVAFSSVKVTGVVPLTDVLVARVQSGDLAAMDTSTVEAYLLDNLQWRVATFDGRTVSCEDVAELSVTVVSADVKPAIADDSFPQWGNFTRLVRIGQGQCGGS